MKRVVADTNVVVSAIEFGGKPKQLLDLALDGHIDLAISEAILEETFRVLKDRFHRTPAELRRDRQAAPLSLSNGLANRCSSSRRPCPLSIDAGARRLSYRSPALSLSFRLR